MSEDMGLSGSYLLPGVTLPRRIDRLIELVFNLVWSWQPDAQELFKLIEELWLECYHNPVKFLRQVKRKSLNAAIHSKRFLELYDRVMTAFDTYMKPANTWYTKTHGSDQPPMTIAYFSTEFGLHESFPTYAGGLGILSGDHAKEASDLGLPFVGVGFLYNQGYFSQHITEDGWQQADYRRYSFDDMPVIPF